VAWGTGSMPSRLRERWPELAWAVFALANLVTIVVLTKWETIPFHFIWVSLTLVYGFRVWRIRSTVLVLALVMVLTGGALLWTVLRGHERLDEVTEVPLMAAMFVAMVWNARRRQAAVDEAERLARTEHLLLERQREFVRDASHELRTPITVARGHLDLARSTKVDPSVLDDLEIAGEELERLSSLSERLLLLAAADHPSFLSKRDVDVGAFLADSVRRWSPAADRVWTVDVRAEGVVIADPGRLAVAVDSLIENAIEATQHGDEIRLRACAFDGRLAIDVVDTGVGIPVGQGERVFERFARADADRGRGSGGTGLGLSIVRAIADAHGGSVAIADDTSGATVLRIELPDYRPASTSTGRSSGPGERPVATGGTR
jgi:two-component system OmpR family sensor kinase